MVFRHKWLITIICGLSILVAVTLYIFVKPPYASDAKLYVKYVMENKTEPGVNDPKIKIPNERGGESVINNELEILTSFDLAKDVATAFGPGNIVKNAGKDDVDKAAYQIVKGLIPGVRRKSDVLSITLQHPDGLVVRPLLDCVITNYLARHTEVHRAVTEYNEWLRRQADLYKNRLAQTENELRNLRTNLNLTGPVEEARRGFAELQSRLSVEIMTVQSDLEEKRAEAYALSRFIPTNQVMAAASAPPTNQPAGSNAVAAAAPPPAAKVSEYKRLSTRLEGLTKREQDLLAQFTPENKLVKEVQGQIADLENKKQKLEDEYPALVGVRAIESKASGSQETLGLKMDIIEKFAKVPALEKRLKVLQDQLAALNKNMLATTEKEGVITNLERQRATDESYYNSYNKQVLDLLSDQQVAASQASNLVLLQKPTPGYPDNRKLMMVVVGVVLGGFALAFVLAFLMEFQFDQSIRRPVDVELKVGLPLFLTIPRLKLHNGSASNGRQPAGLLPESTEKAAEGSTSAAQAVAVRNVSGKASVTPAPLETWDPRHSMRPYVEALRDRLMTYFEVKNMTHKPKLVAVTSCGGAAGVSSISAGLAASLSETGEGNVLLVDMNEAEGAAHQFFRGNLAVNLDDVLEVDKRGPALVQENLYVASEMTNADKLPGVMPKRFKSLVPRLKASDYDYIIFDMPPVSQISMTPRLSRFMDMVLMVVESEKTDREVVKKASGLLAESQATVGVVLNKAKPYLPKKLRQDI
jgi:uncharacterized protein involved in exopolysaccharide biosynthesis/Mrp family chromosome partitioning ATPase